MRRPIGHTIMTLIIFALTTVINISSAQSRDWTDTTGKYKVSGTFIAMDDHEIVIKLDVSEKGRELLAFPIDNLSDTDRRYLESDEIANQIKGEGEKHSWKLRNGLTVFGKVVEYGRREVTIQRRRGKIYVNDRPLDTLPEVYRRLIPRVVEHFEGKKFQDDKDFLNWAIGLKAAAKTFKCEGVMLELINGEEYALPFFIFSDKDQQVLKPGWEKWLATQGSESDQVEQNRQHALYLQSQVSAYQQQMQQAELMQIARLQLQLTAVAAGAVDMWEVFLYPGNGVRAYPRSVVVYANNSDTASRMAIANNPGFVLGPVRKIAGN